MSDLSEKILTILKSPPERAKIRAYAENFDWNATTEGQIRIFEEIIDRLKANHDPY